MKYLLLLFCSFTVLACSDDGSKRGNGAAARGPRQFEAIAGSCGGGATAGSCGQGSMTVSSGSCPLTASIQALAATKMTESSNDRVVVQLSLEGCPACVTKKAELTSLASESATSFTELKLDGDDPHASNMAFPQVLVVEGGQARLAPAELNSLF